MAAVGLAPALAKLAKLGLKGADEVADLGRGLGKSPAIRELMSGDTLIKQLDEGLTVDDILKNVDIADVPDLAAELTKHAGQHAFARGLQNLEDSGEIVTPNSIRKLLDSSGVDQDFKTQIRLELNEFENRALNAKTQDLDNRAGSLENKDTPFLVRRLRFAYDGALNRAENAQTSAGTTAWNAAAGVVRWGPHTVLPGILAGYGVYRYDPEGTKDFMKSFGENTMSALEMGHAGLKKISPELAAAFENALPKIVNEVGIAFAFSQDVLESAFLGAGLDEGKAEFASTFLTGNMSIYIAEKATGKDFSAEETAKAMESAFDHPDGWKAGLEQYYAEKMPNGPAQYMADELDISLEEAEEHIQRTTEMQIAGDAHIQKNIQERNLDAPPHALQTETTPPAPPRAPQDTMATSRFSFAQATDFPSTPIFPKIGVGDLAAALGPVGIGFKYFKLIIDMVVDTIAAVKNSFLSMFNGAASGATVPGYDPNAPTRDGVGDFARQFGERTRQSFGIPLATPLVIPQLAGVGAGAQNDFDPELGPQ